MSRRRVGAIGCILLLGTVAAAATRPAGKTGTVVVPDRFLRRWDPITVFFAADRGPARGGPEDAPEKYLTLSPAHPVAADWLDARTLQIRPVDPWPPLARIALAIEGRTTTLATLLPAPLESFPEEGATGLDPVSQMVLKFPDPMAPDALRRMIRVELRPLPGIGSDGARWLGDDDLKVKALERRDVAEPAAFAIGFEPPIPLGTRAIVHLRLALDDSAAESFVELAFDTAEPFRVVEAGCAERRVPISLAGSRYGREQALRCDSGTRQVVVELSATPAAISPIDARNLVRFTPSPDRLDSRLDGRTLTLTGNFAWDTLYRLELRPLALTDTAGRPLQLDAPSELFLHFPRQPAYLRWASSQGVVERFGPQQVPVEGRGDERVDLRIYKVDPLDRSFWPFGNVVTDESARPPGPGEEPPPFTLAERHPTTNEIAQRIPLLGSPPVSTLIDLPLRREGGSARFGVDISSHLTAISGANAPGTYLVGLRRLDRGTQRYWSRVQVTDLSLTAVEEPFAVEFTVTSLQSGRPVPAAEIALEGRARGGWKRISLGTTDARGHLRWKAPGPNSDFSIYGGRIVVKNGSDVLVLDPSHPPDRFADGQWHAERETWLGWAFEPLNERGPQRTTQVHIFTERPVYRPEEPVYIKGWLRHRDKGRLTIPSGSGAVVVEGPGGTIWRTPLTLSATGAFAHVFKESTTATGIYWAQWEDPKRNVLARTSFRIEAYRLPQFEIDLHGPDRVPLDRPFDVSLTATYYAGGRVVDRPVAWRVTQFPYSWVPKALEGFLFSSDGRFSRTARFESTPRLDREATTDATGAAAIALDPTIEPTAEARTYVIEATVTGPDDQTVTATRSILALPPFVLGLSAPRYVERAAKITPQIVAIGPDEKPLAGQDVTLRLLHRQWHSYLRASDFSDGVARYETDVVDEKVFETSVKSAAEPLAVDLPIARSGVYIVEIESRDRLGRTQVVAVDLFAAGDEPVAWDKPSAPTFRATADRATYRPGETAKIVVESPFQSAEALVVIEAPDGNEYRWQTVTGGSTTISLPILPNWSPRLPLHVVLMRGRLTGTQPSGVTDAGKPATLATTTWLDVDPTALRATIELEHPKKALPGETIPMTIRLKDPDGRPLAGEVTLWLVDAAVLALGREQRLDPVPDFLTAVASHLSIRDTRNLAWGELPFAENPGGDGDEGDAHLLDRATVRKNFKTVPYYEAALQVDASGERTVQIALPDNLTVFKVRAKAACGAERFAAGTSELAVRLPLVAQPALPRFVRPGDRFSAAAIGRVVEGDAGPGAAEIRVDGLALDGAARRDVTWVTDRAERLAFPVAVPNPEYGADGQLSRHEVTVRIGVERASDHARDAFEVKLPIRPDRDAITKRTLADLLAGQSLDVPVPTSAARKGTLRRAVVASSEPALVRMATALDLLLAYPYGCTEQRLSAARAQIALAGFRRILQRPEPENAIALAVRDTQQWITSALDSGNLVGFWPGGEGSVTLTAWSAQFLLEAKAAGFAIDEKLQGRLLESLEQALRSDYSHFIDGEAYTERAWALMTLARAGRFDRAYAGELARRGKNLGLEAVASVVLAYADAAAPPPPELVRAMWDGTITRLYQGREIYGGLQSVNDSRNARILPSEARTLAGIVRASSRSDAKNAKFAVLLSGLVTLGQGNGWGSTNADAEALLALSSVLKPPFAAAGKAALEGRIAGGSRALAIGPNAPLVSWLTLSPEPAQLVSPTGAAPVVVRSEVTWVPAEDGSFARPATDGFVVTRELLAYRSENEPLDRRALGDGGMTVVLTVGDIVEDHVQIVNPEDRHYVAVVVPLAAGLEGLNPHLATAPPEARAKGALTAPPTYVAFLDDQVAYFYDQLPKGTYDFYFRARATVDGSFVQPPAKAEKMYDAAVRGASAGARIEVRAGN